MTVTYTNIINAMIEADKRGLDVEKVVLTAESMNTFLADDKFTEADEQRQKDTIGTNWSVEIEEGSTNFLVAGEEKIVL